jgi:hypothetical protein
VITIENRVGRLMEGRFEGPLTGDQLKAFAGELAQLIVKAGKRLVFVVDWRTCELIPPDLEVKLVGQARSDNFAIERSAFLVLPGRAVTPQIEKLVSLGRNPDRHLFTALPELLAWVEPTLSLEEVARARAFFAERQVG